ncbi:MAG: hypothetical protein SOS98_01640 [Varibaculum sp.]|nr:hypothetical protein [Varibaculum sp.]
MTVPPERHRIGLHRGDASAAAPVALLSGVARFSLRHQLEPMRLISTVYTAVI